MLLIEIAATDKIRFVPDPLNNKKIEVTLNGEKIGIIQQPLRRGDGYRVRLQVKFGMDKADARTVTLPEAKDLVHALVFKDISKLPLGITANVAKAGYFET